MRRAAEEDLLKWFRTKNNRKPLILRGARQVGKSTLVRNFCAANGLELCELNLELTKIGQFEKFGTNFFDIGLAIKEIEALSGISLGKPNTLLFIDEIQEQPKAVSCLRYFYEKHHDIAVIAAGSLLEFTLNDQEFSMPVGRVEFHHLGPMTFVEYLQAVKEEKLIEWIEVGHKKNPSEALHAKAVQYYKTYLFVGGMPAAIKTYLETSDLRETRRIQRGIIDTYKADFSKYATRAQTARLPKVMEYAAMCAGNLAKYSEISRDDKTNDVKKAIELLCQARVVHRANHTNATELPIKAQRDESVFKLYFLDVGLMTCLSGIDFDDILNDRMESFKGKVSEQFIAQHLAYFQGPDMEPELYFWLNNKKRGAAEIDFVIQHKGEIMPIEVKSKKIGSLKSLYQFVRTHKTDLAVNFNLSNFQEHDINRVAYKIDPGTRLRFDLVQVPAYSVEFLPENSLQP
ncbi:MAG: ATP-binding protein [Deltaproteobacteria bacterium]|nr:ATP-binding protein [Deltaproteobacteria bacterium]